jgi:adenylate cyclase
VRELLDSPRDYMQSLGGVLKPVTILFSDIRNFTSISARSEPQAIITQLNEYFTGMVDCVFQHRGTLDKFIGDAVMAVWGNARSDGPAEDAANALRAALAMREKLAELNAKWRVEGRPELEIGIALNHGEAIVGNVGSARRMEFTVIGSAVNVSWRIQEATKLHEADLLLGEAVAELVQDRFDLHSVGNLQAAGVSEIVTLFAVLDSAEIAEPVPLFSVEDQTNAVTECAST